MVRSLTRSSGAAAAMPTAYWHSKPLRWTLPTQQKLPWPSRWFRSACLALHLMQLDKQETTQGRLCAGVLGSHDVSRSCFCGYLQKLNQGSVMCVISVSVTLWNLR